MKHDFELEILPAAAEAAEDRLDTLILRKVAPIFPGLSRAALKIFFGEGLISVNGRIVKPSERLPPGKYRIRIEGVEKAKAHAAIPSPHGAFVPIVYEDDGLLILNKPSGIPSVPHSSKETETAVSSALSHFPALPVTPGKELEPGLLHRLDTLTSGILAFAKTEAEFERLKGLWKARGVQKVYRAICVPTQDEAIPAVIRWPLAHDAKQAKRMRALIPGARHYATRGKALEAETRILSQTTLRAGLSAQPPSYDLEIEIVTGVMHQIRCHLSAAGWPIAGDPIYGGAPASRLWLHSWRLALPLASGQLLRLEAALPTDWPK